MKTKIVYVVVSDDADFYLEQTLVSVYSARLYNPNAEILLLVDSETNKTILGKREAILQYISLKITVDVPKEYSKMQKSRFLKTSLRKYIEGDYLFIDSDTIITEDLSEIDNIPFEIAAVPDKHVIIKNHPRCKDIRRNAKMIEWNFSLDEYYFNSGVFYVKDTSSTHSFYEDWFNKWKKYSSIGVDIDQPSLAKTNEKFNHLIGELNGIWNCQINENGLPFLLKAKIIHYFASTMGEKRNNPYSFYDKKIYVDIKNYGFINRKLHAMILNAKSAFNFPCVIIGRSDVTFFFTNTYIIYSKAKFFFSIIELLSGIVLKIGKFAKNRIHYLITI